jgi:hypothetical protein
VVSALGSLTSTGGAMGVPNGEMDPWADTIVTARFRYVQVSAYYDQLTDVPASRVSELPANAFGKWIAAKQPNIWNDPQAADQVAVAAVGIPTFAVEVNVCPRSALSSRRDDRACSQGESRRSRVARPSERRAAATTRFWQLAPRSSNLSQQ